MIETRLLNYFLAVAREQNITKAAQALHVTQPTLSKQMMVLESQLGKTLFVRGKRHITLTEEGRFLKSKAEEIVSLINKTEDALLTDTLDLHGDITIGCGETLGMKTIMDAFAKFHLKHPLVSLHTHSGDAAMVTDRLDMGLIDIGIMLSPVKEDRFQYLDLHYKDKFGILMRKDSHLAHKEALSAEDIKDLPLILSQQTLACHHNLDIITDNLESLNIIATYNLLYNATFLVEAGIGHALCLENLVDTSTNRNLTFRLIEPKLAVDLFLVTKKYETKSPALKEFIKYILEEIQ